MAKKRRKPKMEFRYYQMSAGSPILALLGQKWVQNYGNDVDYLHFHNYLEIGYCYDGNGHMVLGEEEERFYGGIVTVIPPNYPHTTNSDIGTVSKWEYLFIDVEGFMKKFLDNPVKADMMIQRIYSRALFFEEKGRPVSSLMGSASKSARKAGENVPHPGSNMPTTPVLQGNVSRMPGILFNSDATNAAVSVSQPDSSAIWWSCRRHWINNGFTDSSSSAVLSMVLFKRRFGVRRPRRSFHWYVP